MCGVHGAKCVPYEEGPAFNVTMRLTEDEYRFLEKLIRLALGGMADPVKAEALRKKFEMSVKEK